MNTILPAVILAGDRLARGKIGLSPAGITRGSDLIPWTTARRVGGQETQTDFRPVRGAAGAALFGAAASVVAGPVGIAAAVAVGAASGLRSRETFDVVFDDGSFITIRAAAGMTAKVQDWQAAARAALPPPAQAFAEPRRSWKSRLLPRK